MADRVCPAGCSGHGNCYNGTCECNPGWHGLLCATSDNAYRSAKLQLHQAWRAQLLLELCPGNCSGHGTCLHGNCYCERGFLGVACAEVDKGAIAPGCPLDCRGHGMCVSGVCMCAPGFAGTTCLPTLGPVGSLGVPAGVKLRELEERQALRNANRRHPVENRLHLG